MDLRLENEQDFGEVEQLTREAFWNHYSPGCSEHLVVHKLRSSAAFVPELDYVAIEDNRIVGSIFYSKMFFGPEHRMSEDVLAFGPISVLPAYQRRGIGRRMIACTTSKARELGYKAVLITGDSRYYNPLGFTTASRYGVHLKGIPAADEAVFFMAMELEAGYLSSHPGVYDFDQSFVIDQAKVDQFDKRFPPKVKREPLPTDLP
ncbi:MAG: GNAT family N-acetyltransferase [Anaerolineae bacterium]